jgi:hypothetical protein
MPSLDLYVMSLLKGNMHKDVLFGCPSLNLFHFATHADVLLAPYLGRVGEVRSNKCQIYTPSSVCLLYVCLLRSFPAV